MGASGMKLVSGSPEAAKRTVTFTKQEAVLALGLTRLVEEGGLKDPEAVAVVMKCRAAFSDLGPQEYVRVQIIG